MEYAKESYGIFIMRSKWNKVVKQYLQVRLLMKKLIKEIEEKLKDKSIDKYEKVKLKDDLRKYTMTVHPNDIRNYERARRNKTAISYNNIRLSDYEYIKVIECNYDEVGYKKMDYKTEVRTSNIW